MKEFLVGLLVFVLVAVLSVGGLLLFPLLLILGIFLRLLIMLALVLFAIWLVGKFVLLLLEALTKKNK